MFIGKISKYRLFKAFLLLFLLIMLLYPGATFRGASSGLLLWFQNILPNLLPFIILSNLIVKLNIARHISRIFHPMLGKLLGISSEGCYPIIFGFLSGIPMGAKTTADLVLEKRITRQEGQFLIGLCNNASPMFILGYISLTQLKLPQIGFPLFALIYVSSILGALLTRFLFLSIDKSAGGNVSPQRVTTSVAPIQNSRFSFAMVDEAIMNGFDTITRIGGYIILFSILTQIIKEMIPTSGMIKSIIMGILEITTGISQICSVDHNVKIKIVLVTVLTTFGGLSGIAQTKSVIQDSRLSIKYYVITKIMSAAISFILCLFYLLSIQ